MLCGIGGQFVESDAEILHGIRAKRDHRPGHRQTVLRRESFELRLEQVADAGAAPFGVDQEIV
ncbi:hypothetical protein X747_20680 [Mesorhizobium sp. LNJC384A00]|nr:hypothetical protein X766_19330 [Mesorhizobium sp. LSJC255A00]ESX25945.1 hypothetical protein X765_24260 [Mesorhizobium sp. LSHC440B00]ESX34054.1 hypothetical protein X763_22965 [Mesorhizobium sp. LSHC432A00]ESX35003.1 hypothetical protein X764_27130 [Mesorhizobium sp. LSHC440A00]ESX68291.1 hypothetical protein X757_27885 [Mesorhizobium sp. LSHC414A00]ESY25737.1 hypothetical protein X750_04490 [Mesorhizobium sp. LNJC394B00]ESY29428.1 hypothetical protein X749_15840 [Mesorhizobium sp. LNJC3